MKPKYTDRTRYPHGYKPSHDTDVKATFRRIQREQAEREAKAKANAAEAAKKVEPMRTKKAA